MGWVWQRVESRRRRLGRWAQRSVGRGPAMQPRALSLPLCPAAQLSAREASHCGFPPALDLQADVGVKGGEEDQAGAVRGDACFHRRQRGADLRPGGGQGTGFSRCPPQSLCHLRHAQEHCGPPCAARCAPSSPPPNFCCRGPGGTLCHCRHAAPTMRSTSAGGVTARSLGVAILICGQGSAGRAVIFSRRPRGGCDRAASGGCRPQGGMQE